MIGFSKIIPLMIIVFVLAFSVRITEVVTGVRSLSGSAIAEEAKNDTDKKEEESSGHNKEEQDGVKVVSEEDAKAPEWRDASDSDIDISGVKMEMFKDLAKRRKELDDRAAAIDAQEALLKATAQEVERKVQELSKLRNEIESLLNKQSEEEKARILSLVKIYEGMKPKDAARIFDTLDLDVLVSVMSQMSERKVAPVLASMSEERARTITIMLAEQKKLPELR